MSGDMHDDVPAAMAKVAAAPMVSGDDARLDVWRETVCCGMPYRTEGAAVTGYPPATAELVTHPAGPAMHRTRALCCIRQRPGLPDDVPVCRTCCDTGLVLRREPYRTAVCPEHCEAGWQRVQEVDR